MNNFISDFLKRGKRKVQRLSAVAFSDEEIKIHLSQYHVLSKLPSHSEEEVENRLKVSGAVDVLPFILDEGAFDAYCREVDYETTYPKYFQEFGKQPSVWKRKQLEHFISFVVLNPQPGQVFMDVAASNSPVADILMRRYTVSKAYKQDLRYPSGVHGDTIGSNANAIPLPDASIHGIVTHNSWEHFEGRSDLEFLIEAARLLAPGGGLCIIPADVSVSGHQITSPSIWHRKLPGVFDPPDFDKRIPVVVDDNIGQRLAKYHSCESLLEDIRSVPSLRFTLHVVQNANKIGFQRYFLTARKSA